MKSKDNSLFVREERNLLIAGHRVNRLPQNEGDLELISKSMRDVIGSVKLAADRIGQHLRIFTGLSSGVDQIAAAIAGECDIPLHIIAPCHLTAQHVPGNAFNHVALVSHQMIDTPPETWVAASDDAKLALADVVLVVWDGQMAQGHLGGATRLLIAALRTISPVIWVDARCEFAGRVRILDTRRLDAQTLVKLNSEDADVCYFHDLFVDATTNFDPAIQDHILPYWSMDHVRALDQALQQDSVDPKEKSTRVGWWHSNFLALFGQFNRKKAGPVLSWRPPVEVQKVSGLPENTWLWFERFDRTATHAANKHRDQIVLIHLLSSFAVFGAVSGAINFFSLGSVFWGLFELATLLGISVIVWRDQHSPINAHAAWLHFRQAAEALRMSAILHPLLARLDALYVGIWRPAKDGELPTVAKPYHWLVIQLLREAGLPLGGLHSIEAKREEILTALKSFICDQINYHKKNYHRIHTIHHRMHTLTQSVFFLVIITILIHIFALSIHALEHSHVHVPNFTIQMAEWIHHQHWWLLITAFFPALAAGLHGIMSKLGLQQVARSSQNMHEKLLILNTVVDSIQNQDSLMTLRALAIETATTMYAEHDAWVELMQDQHLEIPA